MKFVCHLLIVFISAITISAFAVELGSPPIQNFTPPTYKGHTQNWAAIQDQRGVMYFGNSEGIVTYDGVRWGFLAIANRVPTRGLAITPEGTIFYGAIGDFGYIQAKPNGQLEAISLRAQIPAPFRIFNDVWQVLNTKDGVYFFTRENIFRYHQGRLTVLNGKYASSPSVLLNGNLFYVDADFGLSAIHGDEIEHIAAFRNLTTTGRLLMAPFDGHKLLVARTAGDLFLFDMSSAWIEQEKAYDFRFASAPSAIPFKSEVARFLTLEQGSGYRLIQISAETYGVSSLKSGILIFNRDGRVLRAINRKTGLVDNTITNLFVDKDKNLWATSGSGISHIELSASHTSYGIENGLEGLILSVFNYQDRVYVGTIQQMYVEAPYRYSTQNPLPQFVPVRNSHSSTWQFLEHEGELLATGDDGLMIIKNDAVTIVPNSPGRGFDITASSRWPGYLFMGMTGGLAMFKKDNGKWVSVGRIEGIKDNIRKVAADMQGNLWLSSDVHGLSHVTFVGNSPEQVEIQHYSVKDGLPFDENLLAHVIDKKMIVTSQKGIYRFIDDKTTSAKPHFSLDPDFLPLFEQSSNVFSSITSDDRGGYIITSGSGISWLRPSSLTRFIKQTSPFDGIAAPDVPIRVDKTGVVWISNDRLTRVDPRQTKKLDLAYKTLIRQVSANGRDTLFAGNFALLAEDTQLPTHLVSAQAPNQVLELAHTNNGLNFEFAAASFEKPSALQFRFKLEGFDPTWSEWSRTNSKEYTNLPSGTYTFKVTSRNVYGKEGNQAQFTFTILTPWYRTVWAILLWISLGIALLAICIRYAVKFYTRRLRFERDLLEELVTQRTQELRELSLCDPLTGLRNRRYLNEILVHEAEDFALHHQFLMPRKINQNALAKRKVLGVFVIDLDYFKLTNDQYGHEAGDAVLKQFAAILSAAVRDSDAVVRLGGEEFLVVLNDAHHNYLEHFAKTLLDKVAQAEFTLASGEVLHKTCSIGYTPFPFDAAQADAISFEQTIALADLAMYYAKHHGRNRAHQIVMGQSWQQRPEDFNRILAAFEDSLAQAYIEVR